MKKILDFFVYELSDIVIIVFAFLALIFFFVEFITLSKVSLGIVWFTLVFRYVYRKIKGA